MKKFTIIIALLLVNLSFSQKTYLYFQNNTSLPFQVSATQSGSHVMESSEWWSAQGTTIQPWKFNTNILWTNRDAGIHNNIDFFLTVNLTQGSNVVQLKLKLNGNLVGSDIWASAGGPGGWSHPWYSDRNFHAQTFTMNGKSFTLKYAFYYTGGYDDILYTLQEDTPDPMPAAEATDPHALNVLAYNVYMRPSELFFDDQSVRSKYIHDHVHGYDAILFEEVFDDDQRTVLLNKLAPEYPYQSTIVDIANHGALDPVQDGGVLIVSKWPIITQDQLLWGNTCNQDDCLAYKGVKYVKINKLGRNYHLFGTHMDAFNEQVDVDIRKTQLTMFKNYVDSKGIPADEAVIMGGDLNVDSITNKWGEYDSLFTNHFKAKKPTYIPSNVTTWDPNYNSYLEGASDPKEFLDYVLVRNDKLIPTTYNNKTMVIRGMEDEMWKIFDLSDHFGVWGDMNFPVMPINCTSPTGMNVQNITAFTANLSWTSSVSASSYTVRYKTLSSSTWTTATTTATSYSLSGLSPMTTYEFQVQSVCGSGGTSLYTSSTTFTTGAACTDNFETNETRTTAKSVSVNTANTAKISTATDVDWYKFSNTKTLKNIRISLSNLPKDYNVQLYNPKGTLLLTAANTGTTSEYISYNTSTIGTYYIKVYPANSTQYDNANCYTFTATITSSSSRENNSELVEETELQSIFEDALNIYPNPSKGLVHFNITTSTDLDAIYSLYDMQGSEIKSNVIQLFTGENLLTEDISYLPSGNYIFILKNANGIKFSKVFSKD